MPKLSLWNSGIKSKDFTFIDRNISEYIGISGTCAYVHLYLGVPQQNYTMTNPDGTTIPAIDPNNPSPTPVVGGVTTIQDVLFLENRDRKYSDFVYEMRCVYTLPDTMDFDLRQFGLMMSGDSLYLEFHLNDMVSMLGRRLMAGDVIELPHRRDDVIDIDAPAINKFYVVDDASKPSHGWSQTWWPHLWRVKVSPMTASQEFNDILGQQQTNPLGYSDPGTIGDLMSTIGFDMNINDAVVAQAKLNVPKRYFETQQYYMIIPEAENSNPWVFAGDGIPPNGAIPIHTGTSFPVDAKEGDYVLRTDYNPSTLFMWNSGKWRIQEQNWRGDWNLAHRILSDFIQETGTSTFEDGSTAPTKIALSKAVKPKADF